MRFGGDDFEEGEEDPRGAGHSNSTRQECGGGGGRQHEEALREQWERGGGAGCEALQSESESVSSHSAEVRVTEGLRDFATKGLFWDSGESVTLTRESRVTIRNQL